jgi:alpha-glucosidase
MKTNFFAVFFFLISIPMLSGSGAEFISNGNLEIRLEREPFHMIISDPRGRTLMETKVSEGTGPFGFTTLHGQEWSQFLSNWSKLSEGKSEPWKWPAHLLDMKVEDEKAEVLIGSSQEGPAEVRLCLSFTSQNTLRSSIEILKGSDVNRLSAKFRLFPDERFFGFGERFNAAEQHGKKLEVWTDEGPLGLGAFRKIFPVSRLNPIPRGPDITYFPVPFYLSNRGYGFLIDDTHRSEFDLGKTAPGTLEITSWNNRLEFLIFYGPGPLSVIENMTAYTGRTTPPAPWVFAPWNYAIGGSQRVRQVARTAREWNIPNSAIWTEDWAGTMSHEWQVNREKYPDYEQLAHELHEQGFRFLGYFQPYIQPEDPLFSEGMEKGYFITDSDGEPFIFTVVFRKVAQVDLTNPAACEWWKELFQMSVDCGVDGWMTDFSEYTPPYSISSDSRSGWALRNEYPLLWAKVNREFFDEARPDGDYVFFVRAGYTGSQKYAPVMWTGDQNTSWEEYDGLPSVIPAVLSVGISGFPVTATDIAGYHCLTCSPSGFELFARWCELGAMLPVMRNHEGLSPCNNWTFDRSQDTLVLYKKYASLHTALFPYIYYLVKEASQKGWPVARHLYLHYPDDPEVDSIEDEFMLGKRILVAPVIEKGARQRKVYLPQGKWLDFWTGKTYEGRKRYMVPAPLDLIPIFVKQGSIIPFFDAPIDTLVEEDREDIIGWDGANKSMTIAFYGKGEDELTLADGTEIKCESALEESKTGIIFSRLKGKQVDPPQGQRSFGPEGMAVSLSGESTAATLTDQSGHLVAECRVKSKGQSRTSTLKFIFPKNP